MIRLTRRLEDNAVAAMFLDRDGVINVKARPGQYVTSPDDLILIDGAAAAIRRVNELRIPVYIVTNQRWVAHRSDGIPKLRAIHSRLEALLASAGAFVDGIYACGHEINQCECRKPQRGLVDQVLRDNPSLRLSACALVGDSETDIEVAARCGMYSVRLCSGYGSEPGRTWRQRDCRRLVLGRSRTPAGPDDSRLLSAAGTMCCNSDPGAKVSDKLSVSTKTTLRVGFASGATRPPFRRLPTDA